MADELSNDNLRLVKWLIAGHDNQMDDDVQRLRAKIDRILEHRAQEAAQAKHGRKVS
jgi:hypothetical protein